MQISYKTKIYWACILMVACLYVIALLSNSPKKPGRTPYKYLHRRSGRNLILLWTKWFQREYKSPLLKDCPSFGFRCNFTSNRDLLDEAAVVVFHLWDIDEDDMPSTKPIGQKWVYWNHEPPINSKKFFKPNLDEMFDLMFSYRRDSHISAPYGRLMRRKKSTPEKTTEEKELFERFHTQNGAVSMVSNCHTGSNREEYLEELATYYPVSGYGKCGTLSCPKDDPDFCMTHITNSYMFYLAFENSLCKDYITEKFFRTLQYPIIPVTFSSDISLNSIDVGSGLLNATLYTPKQLSEKLRDIQSNFTLYKSFSKWRDFYQVVFDNPICYLCEYLRNPAAQSTDKNIDITGITKWYVDDAHCHRWNPITQKIEESLY